MPGNAYYNYQPRNQRLIEDYTIPESYIFIVKLSHLFAESFIIS